MIAGCVLAFNEELNIVECLQTFRPHVDPLILINMNSTDRTVELARPYVDKIVNHPNVPNFDVVRNLALEHCREDWIFFLDADERLPSRTGEIVRQILRSYWPPVAKVGDGPTWRRWRPEFQPSALADREMKRS